MILIRYVLRLAGDSGTVPNPFFHAQMADDAGQRLHVMVEPHTGRIEGLRLVPSVKVESLHEGEERVSIRLDSTDAEKLIEIVNKILSRRGLQPVTAEIVRSVMRTQRIEGPSLVANLQGSGDWIRAILKIAYEMATYCLGESYTEDEVGSQLRRCMWSDRPPSEWAERYGLRGQIPWSPDGPLEMVRGARPWNHVGVLMEAGDQIACYVSVFGILDGLVEVSRSPARYSLGGEGRLVRIDPVSRTKNESTLAEELRNLISAGDEGIRNSRAGS
jgi:hypothetical protein